MSSFYLKTLKEICEESRELKSFEEIKLFAQKEKSKLDGITKKEISEFNKEIYTKRYMRKDELNTFITLFYLKIPLKKYITDNNETPLYLAIQLKEYNLIKDLLQQSKNDFEAENRYGDNIIALLIRQYDLSNIQDKNIVDEIFKQSVNLNYIIKKGGRYFRYTSHILRATSSFLEYTVSLQKELWVKYLIEQGADVNLNKGKEQNIALHYCKLNSEKEIRIFDYIVQEKNNFNYLNKKGLSPFSSILLNGGIKNKAQIKEKQEIRMLGICNKNTLPEQKLIPYFIIQYLNLCFFRVTEKILKISNINLNLPVTYPSGYGMKEEGIILFYYRKASDIDKIKFLISKGSDINNVYYDMTFLAHIINMNNKESFSKENLIFINELINLGGKLFFSNKKKEHAFLEKNLPLLPKELIEKMGL